MTSASCLAVTADAILYHGQGDADDRYLTCNIPYPILEVPRLLVYCIRSFGIDSEPVCF
jgi:hypothetical protein